MPMIWPKIPLFHRTRYLLERLLLAGILFRLFVIGGLICLIAIIGGHLVWYLAPDPARSYGDTLWWSFLQLTDPGYLGSETHPLRRVIYTLMVALGMATFVGALVATITQWLNDRIRQLERGTTPVPWKGHILVLGWTTRTPFMLRELLQASDRIRHYLLGFSLRRLRICVLAEDVDANMVDTLRNEVCGLIGTTGIVLRSGDPLDPSQLSRGAFLRAGIVILPADRHDNDEADQDAHTIAIAMTMGSQLENSLHKPLLVAEMQNPKKAELLEALYPGQTVVVAADDTLSECAVQCVAQPGVSPFLHAILNQSTEIGLYLKLVHQCGGLTIQQADNAIPGGVLLGMLRSSMEGKLKTILCPNNDEKILANDQLIFLSNGLKFLHEKKNIESFVKDNHPVVLGEEIPAIKRALFQENHYKTVLITGWNRRTASLMATLLDSKVITEKIISLSVIGVELRKKACSAMQINLDFVEFLDADSTQPSSWENIKLDHEVVIIQASDRYTFARDADASTLSVLAVARGSNRHKKNMRFLVELLELDHKVLQGMEHVEALPTTQFMAHMLAQAAMRPELIHVYRSIFDPEKFRLTLYRLSSHPLSTKEVTFAQLTAQYAHSGERILAIVKENGSKLILADSNKYVKVDLRDNLLLLQPVNVPN
jgi:ion channel POLLUX/CASTOR